MILTDLQLLNLIFPIIIESKFFFYIIFGIELFSVSFVPCLADVLNVFVNQNLEIPLPAPLDLELFQVNKKIFQSQKRGPAGDFG